MARAVVEAKTNFEANRVLGASPHISPLESLLPRSVHTTLAQLRSGHCRLLNSYKARITSGISDVCPECGVAPHSAIQHNLQCKTCGTTRLQCSRRLPQPGQLTIGVELLGYHNNNMPPSFLSLSLTLAILTAIYQVNFS